ncbi:hypothetical protein [Candidatus Viadribacter manganicus]|uniref:Transmembrane protein n=1 Tax=Candidatus Viadribacter manganicus TaxID=1759059 RepID=A0A1B1AG37_9PROT|nr:hypothetical protein [Candidatus Viadribacter manganicus]ANP45520.1 hypothetical protein ATE48_06105 [Candidatus Viadribacter manganicus]
MSTTPSPQLEPGRTSAFVVYVLFLLSIPSAAIFALFGIILALAARDGAGPLARSHLDNQIRIWFIAFWWTIGLAVLAIIGWLTLVILVGAVLLWIAGLGSLILFLWFTVKSLLGLLALMDNRPR